MDLKVLQNVVDNLDQLVLKLEGMGFDPKIFDDFIENAEAIKQAGRDARAFRKTAILSIFGASSVICALVAYLTIGYSIEAKLAKIERNKEALEILAKSNTSIRSAYTNEEKLIAVSFEKPLILSDDHKIVYFER